MKDMTTEQVWKEINEVINRENDPILGLNLTYTIHLNGDDGGLYGLQLTDGKAIVTENPLEEADCELQMSVKDFKKLLTGNLNTTAAFMMGKLKVKGNIGLALKLEGLLKQYSFS